MSGLPQKDFALFVDVAARLVEPGEESRARIGKALVDVCGVQPPRPAEPDPQPLLDPRAFDALRDLERVGRRKGLRFVALKRSENDEWSVVWAWMRARCDEFTSKSYPYPYAALTGELALIGGYLDEERPKS